MDREVNTSRRYRLLDVDIVAALTTKSLCNATQNALKQSHRRSLLAMPAGGRLQTSNPACGYSNVL